MMWGNAYITYNNKYTLYACDLNVFGEKIEGKIYSVDSLISGNSCICVFFTFFVD